MCEGFPQQAILYKTPTEYPVIQFHDNTIYQEIVSDPTV